MIFRESELKRMVTTTAQYKKTESHFDSSRNIVRVLFDAIYDIEKERQTVLQNDLILQGNGSKEQ